MQQNQAVNMMMDDREKIELQVSCRNLKSKDFLSASDPYVKFTIITNNIPSVLGKTESLNNEPNPNFKKKFLVDFIFEVEQKLLVEVFDQDDMSKDDLIGTIQTSIGQIVGSKNQVFIRDINNNGKIAGKLIIKADKVVEGNEWVFWAWKGTKLINVDTVMGIGIFDKSDPFLKILKKKGQDEYYQVHQTEYIKNNLNPMWKPFQIQTQKLCNGDHQQNFRIECWDNEKSGKHQFMGYVDLNLDQIFKQGQTQFELQNPKKNKRIGNLEILQKNILYRPTFIDYIRGGIQLNLCVAVDYTGSNGTPSHPSSLHALNPNNLNQYQQAMLQVGQILLNYDSDQQIPFLGFGAKPRFAQLNSNQVNHCFPVTGNPSQFEVLGLDGLFQAYTNSLHQCELSGPTYFNPVLQYVSNYAKQCSSMGVYTILLILTDGAIHDMEDTMKTIINSSGTPLSIIIVGIGNADFTSMEILDGDEGLRQQGSGNIRDCVQFVPFNQYQNNPTLLAQKVLEELPKQLVEYYTRMGIEPKQTENIGISKY